MRDDGLRIKGLRIKEDYTELKEVTDKTKHNSKLKNSFYYFAKASPSENELQ